MKSIFLRSTLLAAVLALPLAATAQTSPGGGAGQQPSSQGASAVEAAFKRADTNGDGKLSKEESARLPSVASKFDELDKDKDGFLSKAEFMAAFEMK